MSTNPVRTRPGGALATRPLHFFWLADCSGSMSLDGKIQALNNGIRETIPHMRRVAEENPHAQVLIRAIAFGSGARWHIGTPTPVDEFQWTELQAAGETDLGKALELLAAELKVPPMSNRALAPVLVLVSDGRPTDAYQQGLKALELLPWGKKAVRVAIAIGEDADRDVLEEFIGKAGPPPLQANNPEALVSQIRWVSTAVLSTVSAPPSQTTTGGNKSNVPIPQPPPPATGGDVW